MKTTTEDMVIVVMISDMKNGIVIVITIISNAGAIKTKATINKTHQRLNSHTTNHSREQRAIDLRRLLMGPLRIGKG